MKRLVELYSALSFEVFLRHLFTAVTNKIKRQGDVYYSQTGEDLIIEQLLPAQEGFFVDVGCNHPIDLSNTFRFYLRGWRGISIDANAELIALHKKFRPEDTAICAAVSDKVQMVTFHKSELTAVSTIDEKTLGVWKEKWKFNESDQSQVETTTLDLILEKHLPPGQKIDLLTVDVEGHDFEVLKGISLDKYRPQLIVVEIHNLDLNLMHTNEISKYLTNKGYRLRGYVTMNAYFEYDP